ncbi:hypothetical protein ACWGIN_31555 [Streptomyces sp. NPDC054861]
MKLFAAVAAYAWRESSLRVEVPEKPMMWPQYARGVPIHVADKRRTLYGIVRPCPDLAAACPTLAQEPEQPARAGVTPFHGVRFYGPWAGPLRSPTRPSGSASRASPLRGQLAR